MSPAALVAGDICDMIIKGKGLIFMKNSTKKFISAFLSVSVLVSALSGCNSDNWGTPTPAERTTPAETTTNAPETTTASQTTTTEEDTAEPVELLQNREKAENGLVTDIAATELKGSCVAQNTSFRITLSRNAEFEELIDRIGTYPEADFTLTRESDTSYILSSEAELPEDTVVRVEVSDENGSPCDSWAFQTAETFKVKSTYPADGANGVYTNAGIEIEFSASPSKTDIGSFVEITPEIEYKTQFHRNTLYLVPENKMELGTEYTVTLKNGLTSADGEALAEDFSFSFTTAQFEKGDYFYTNYGLSETFLEGDPTVIEIYCSDSLKSKEFDISLYRFGSAEEYITELTGHKFGRSRTRYYTDTAGLEQIYTAKEKPLEGLNSWKPLYFILPEGLTNGYYVADMQVSGMRCQYFIQLSPLSVYSMRLGEENLFFLNDTETGNAASGAKITFEAEGKTYTASADSDGTANLITPEGGEGLLDITWGGMRYIDIYSTCDVSEIGFDDLYYMYIYTDREAYLPTDTIQVWGVVRPRRSDAPVPENLKLSLGSETSGQVKEITLSEDGSFRTEFSYSDYSETYWLRIYLMSGDQVMDSKGVQVEEYVKPTYNFDAVLPEYAVMPHRNTVPLEITAQYYEGTPAKNLLFESSAYKCSPSTMKTDANGYTSAELLFYDDDTWRVQYEYHRTQLSGIENEYTNEYDYFYAFYRDVMLEHEYDKDSHSFTVYTNKMNFDNIEAFLAQDDLSDYEILKGESADTDVTISITHYWSELVEGKTYYDFIEKETRTLYDYKQHEEYIGTFKTTTKNGVGVFENLPTTSEKGYYTVKISYKDSLGQSVEMSTSFGNRTEFIWNYSNANRLYFDFDFYNGTDEETMYFGEGDTLQVKLGCNHEIEDKGKILFASYQNDIIHYDIYEGISFEYSPSLDCLPNFVAQGAYFDGRHIYPISLNYMYFQPSARNITLSVTTDEDTYDAGETVYMTVNAKDENGNPVNGATVMLSVVDEAAFAIAEQEVDILGDLYETVWYDTAGTYYSYIQHVLDNETLGEKGGGGESGVRKDFKDTAYFGSVTTDKNGNAEFVFKLPDNLTTWRATVQSIKNYETGRILAGDLKYPIISTRPVFVTPIMLSTYIEGDDIALTAKASGIDADDPISITITGENVNETISVLSAQTANFGKLPTGEYTVLFTTENNGNSDAMELPLTVTDTILQTDITLEGDFSEGFDISPVSWPVKVSFFDKEYMFITNILTSFSRVYGSNLATRVGANYAYKELGYITEEEFAESFAFETISGLAKPLPAAEEDLTLTALLCAAVPEIVNKNAVAEKLEEILSDRNSDKADVCEAYLGLAGLGEPVLNEVRSLLESGEITDYYQRMYLVSALALCGDYSTAYKYYSEYVPEVAVYGEGDNLAAYVNCSDKSQQKEYTKTALMAAALLKLPEADYFARSIMNGSYDFMYQYESVVPEVIVYIKNYVPKVQGDAQFTYNLNGETQTVTLDRHKGYCLSFGEEQWKNADFTVTSGAIYSVVRYEGRKTELPDAPTMSVTKSISGDLTPGGLVTVTIKAEPHCTVYDVIPSCGRYSGTSWSRSGQKIVLYTGISGIATYKFRIVTEGEYVLESAVVQDNYGNWGESGRRTITVNKDETV